MPNRQRFNQNKKEINLSDEALSQKGLKSHSLLSVSKQVRTSLHPLEEHENDRRFREKALSDSTESNFEIVPVVRMSSTLYEGFSSFSSIESRYLFSLNSDSSWKRFKMFLHSEQSVMFYTNVFLAMSFGMLFGGFLQFCLGIVSINRKVDQPMLVRKEMKTSFYSYGHDADITKRWNAFQIEFTCCGMYGVNSYVAEKMKLPDSCYEIVCPQFDLKCQKIPHDGCFEIVKILEAKLLDPVILITQFCSVLQISNAILALNLLRPKPKARRYQVHYKTPNFTLAQK